MQIPGRKALKIDATTDLSRVPPEQARELLAASLVPDPTSGVLRLSDEPCVIVRPEAIVNIQKQLEQTIGGSSKGVLYLSGERSSHAGVSPLEPILRSSARLTIDGAKRIADASALLGWGRAEITSFDPVRARLLLSLTNSPLALAYGPSKKPVCHFLAGWIAGLGQILLEREVLCEETACAAQGRERCEFELRSMPTA